MRLAKLPMGELEAMVMDALWEAGGWRTPGEVHERISRQRPLAYTTVKTILDRLWQKDRLRRERDGRAFAYRPVHSREQQAATGMQHLLVEGEDRPATLSCFVEGLSSADRDQLRRILHHREPS